MDFEEYRKRIYDDWHKLMTEQHARHARDDRRRAWSISIIAVLALLSLWLKKVGL